MISSRRVVICHPFRAQIALQIRKCNVMAYISIVSTYSYGKRTDYAYISYYKTETKEFVWTRLHQEIRAIFQKIDCII